jgi:pilus assembly protein Flp/PilA
MLTGPVTPEDPMRALYTKYVRDNAGVTAIEYGLIAALVAVVCIAAWKILGTSLSTTFSDVAGSL